MAAALPSGQTWPARPRTEDLAGLPGCPAVLLFVDESGTPVQLLTTQHLKRVASARLITREQPRRRGRADLAAIVRGIRWRPVYCPFEARWWYYRLARLMHPHEYRELVSFGPAWFLHVDWEARVPIVRVTERVWRLRGQFVGPWPTQKSCQQALEGLRDLFDLCRYPEEVRKAPDGSRCSYAEMGRCDAPCDGSAPLEHYVERSRAAWAFVGGAVDAWIASATGRMKRAGAQQRYELAGQIKQQLAFAQTWRERWLPVVRPAVELNLLVVIPATRRKAWKLFLFWQGQIIDGPLLADRKLAAQTPIWLGAALQKVVSGLGGPQNAHETSQPPGEVNDVVRMEQTWLLGHFLQHREARTAILEELPSAGVPPDLEGSLRDTLARCRAASQK
jgi:DNA polymerase-3 subunit epsilon